MGMTKVTRNYQITLPKDIREIENVRVGDRFILTTRDDEIVMKRVRGDVLGRVSGAWGTRGSGSGYVRKIRDESEKRLKRLSI